MYGRRSVLSAIGSVIVGKVLSRFPDQEVITPVTVDVTSESDSISLSKNEDVEGPAANVVSERGEGVRLSADVDQDALTVFESVLGVTNEGNEEKQFAIVGKTLSDGPADLRVGERSVVSESTDGTDIIAVEGGDSVDITFAIDLRRGAPTEIDADGTLRTDSQDTNNDDNGSGGSDFGGCVITTAASSDPATLDSLRQFRDDSMERRPIGRALLALYYRLGTPVANTLEEYPQSRTRLFVRWVVRRCASLADRQRRSDSRVESAVIAVTLTGVYMIGGIIGLIGHMAIRARENIT